MPKTTEPDQNDAPINLDAIDFSGVQTGFALKEPGRYPATIEETELRMSQAGNPMINVTFALDDGGRAWRSYVLTPKALPFVKQMALRAGVDEDKLSGSLSATELMAELKNRRVQVDLDIEKYTSREGEQKERNNVKNVYNINDDGGSVASSGQRKRGW